jgi:hypothetical protein
MIRLSSRLRMISAHGEQAAIELWETVERDGTRWFWPADHSTPGEHVHVYACPSDGYGGAVLRFRCKDATYECKGPFHSNTDALFAATGVDLRDKHRTWGVVAQRREWEGLDEILHSILHEDPPEGVIGTFNRVDEIAQKLADERREVLAVYSQSRGGSSSGWAYPTHEVTIGKCVVRYRIMHNTPHLVTVDGAVPHRRYGRLMSELAAIVKEAHHEG